MSNTGNGQTRIIFHVPASGLIGYRTEFMSMTRGYGILNHTFEDYRPVIRERIGGRRNGVLVSIDKTSWSPAQDLTVNITKVKAANNIRSATKEQTTTMKKPRVLTLEEALEFINEDELVEVTPETVRLRKKILGKSEREKSQKKKKFKLEAE